MARAAAAVLSAHSRELGRLMLNQPERPRAAPRHDRIVGGLEVSYLFMTSSVHSRLAEHKAAALVLQPAPKFGMMLCSGAPLASAEHVPV